MLHFRAIVHRHNAAWVVAPDLCHNSATANELYRLVSTQAAAQLTRDGSGESTLRGAGEVPTAVQRATVSMEVVTGRLLKSDDTLSLPPQSEDKLTRMQR